MSFFVSFALVDCYTIKATILWFFSCIDDNDCIECDPVLDELEKIDGEADLFGIDFVKIASVEAAQKFGILNIPALVYFR